jgi:hypothetical protein
MEAEMRIVLLIIVGWLAAASVGSAQERSVVVVELFTSQGCSSCPPADELMGRLAKRENVIALSLHVDYWDYIGWKDKFASPDNTARQNAYAIAGERRSVYTPQMIVNGMDHTVGTATMKVMDLIRRHSGRKPAVTVRVEPNSKGVRIQAQAKRQISPAVVQLAYFSPSKVIMIKRGENAGRTLSYANVVNRIEIIGRWNGISPLVMDVSLKQNQHAALIVQQENHGAIFAAALLR